MALRGFAVFWVLAFAAAGLGWLQALAVHDAGVDDAQLALTQLAQKRVVDRDVAHVLEAALADAHGSDAKTKLADAVARLVRAESFLESEYARLGVELDVFFGFWSDAEREAWLEALAHARRLQKCPRCLDLQGGVVASVLSASDGLGVVVSRDGLARGGFPFLPFGVPVLGAVYRFGDVLGVVVL